MVVDGFDVVCGAVDGGWALLGKTDIEFDVDVGDFVSVQVGLGVVISLDVHISLILIDESLRPLLPLLFVPAIGAVPGVAAHHVAGQDRDVRLFHLD